MANQDPLFMALKWSLVIINIIEIAYIIYFFLTALFSNHRGSLTVLFIINCIIGVLVCCLGLYGAYREHFNIILLYAIILIVNIILSLLGEVYKGHVGLQVILCVLALIFAYILRREGGGGSAA